MEQWSILSNVISYIQYSKNPIDLYTVTVRPVNNKKLDSVSKDKDKDGICRLVNFSQEQNQILRLQTSFHQFQTWLLPGLRKMLTSGIFQQQGGVTVLVSPAILLDSCALLLLWQMFQASILWHCLVIGQMLLPYCHKLQLCFVWLML